MFGEIKESFPEEVALEFSHEEPVAWGWTVQVKAGIWDALQLLSI